jgi:anthranilate synthase component 1
MRFTNLTPFYKEINGDLDTPVSLYLKINQKNSYLLESVIGQEQIARYSYIGFDAFCVFKNEQGENTIFTEGKINKNKLNPIDELRKLVKNIKIESELEIPFLGGAVGYFGWETIAHIEKLKLKDKPKLDIPLAHFMFAQRMLVFDHVKRKIIIIVFASKEEEKKALEKIAEVEEMINKPIPLERQQTKVKKRDDIFAEVQSNYKKEDFLTGVLKAKKYIFEGDIYQMVLSQRFGLKSEKQPFNIYRTLRYINPSPYMYFMNFEDYQIIGASPEILVTLRDKKATLRPIAGTRPRQKKNEAAVVEELLADEKERAEHIMLVDLGRNDLGRVCEFGTVKTDTLMDIEKYSHVMHIVSNVVGKIQDGKDAFDLLKATFPAGTLSGAPKVRAMEIIDELEPIQRGLYGGALGYFDFRGNMDLCIIIRTILAYKDKYWIQAGGGLVADSDPEMEYQESQNKARGMIEACLD